MEGGIKDLFKYRFEKALSNIAVAKTLYASENYVALLSIEPITPLLMP